MSILTDLCRTVSWLLGALVDTALDRRRCCYQTAIVVDAPPELVWKVLSARNVKFDGFVPVEISVAPRARCERILEGSVIVGDVALPISFREVSERIGEGALIEVLKEGSDPKIARGDDYFVGYALAPCGGGTKIVFRHELTHTDFLGRIIVPLGAAQNARRIKAHCEKLAGSKTAANPFGAAAMTGLLTFASFLYLFGWQSAAVLMALIVIHEAGHAIAMRSLGQPLQGIYFIPFFGGVAVAGAPHRSETERGFVALMGPGFSLGTTALFFVAWKIWGTPVFAELALVGAFLNGINLAPVLPLDGGQVSAAIFSRWDPEYAALANFSGLLAATALAVYLEWYLLLVLLALDAAVLMVANGHSHARPPITQTGRIWLAAAYLASIAFYAAIAVALV